MKKKRKKAESSLDNSDLEEIEVKKIVKQIPLKLPEPACVCPK